MGLFDRGDDAGAPFGAQKKAQENRRYRRIALSRPAEVVINAIDVYNGQLVNISPGGAAVICDADVKIGDMATIYAVDVDILPGRVERLLPDGFAVSLLLSSAHRNKLIEKLFTQANIDYAETVQERRATPRHKKADTRNVCRLSDGSSIFVKIIDISVNGAAVDALRKPPVGTTIRLAQRTGIVVRHTPRGFAISFDLPQFKGGN